MSDLTGYLTQYERDVMVEDTFEGIKRLLDHLGVDHALGYDLPEHRYGEWGDSRAGRRYGAKDQEQP